MINRILPIALLSAVIISNTGCKNDGGFKKVKGIEYKIVKDVPGPTAKIGDIVQYHIVAKIDTDVYKKNADGTNSTTVERVDTMVLGDSRKQQNGRPAVGRVDVVKGSGQYQAIFPYMSAGDSAILYVSCDTLIASISKMQGQRPQQLPPWLKKGKKIFVTISLVAIKSMADYQKEMQAEQEQMQKEMQAKEDAQKPIDEKILSDYIAANHIKAEKTASGLYYTITKEGTGEKAKSGEDVTMDYIGKTLTGKQFDANVDESFHPLPGKDPFTFQLGVGQVVKGWDEGIQLLKKGSKATLYLPSALAYGPQSPSPDVPANSILVFNVEVVNIKAHENKPVQLPQSSQQGQQQAPQQ